ncbi:MAG: SMP-30/gluconolactonase/LRE family protein [Verrucomicrobiales bacterium]
MKSLLALCLVAATTVEGSPKLDLIAGTGEAGYAGDGGSATTARLNNPFGVVRGPDQAIYFCDTLNHSIRKIDAAGVITTVVGTGRRGYSGNGGPARQAQLNEPYEVRFDNSGNLFTVERANHCIRRVDMKTGVVSTFAGTGKAGFAGDGGPAAKAQFNEPHSIQFDKEGNLFVCDIRNHRLRRIDQSGQITTIAGNGEKKNPSGGAPMAGSPLFGPRAVDFASDGSLWLALREGNAVYRLDLRAAIIHHVITSDLHGPKGLSVAPDGRVFLADTEGHRITVFNPREHRPRLEIVVGDGKKGVLARPHGVFVEADGAVLIGDSENHRIWRVLSPLRR